MLWTPLALMLQQIWLMKLLDKQGQTTYKFSFQTAEQKQWQKLLGFILPLCSQPLCALKGCKNQCNDFKVMSRYCITQPLKSLQTKSNGL